MLQLNKIYCMDCLEGMKQIEDNSVDLVFADPPYNKVVDIKVQSLSNILFKGFIQDFVKECYRVIKPTGSIYIIMDWREISYFFIALKQIGFIPQNWITWKYYIGIGSRTKYSQRHEDILFFTKSEKYIFNLKDVRVNAKKNLPFRLKNGKMWNPPEVGKKNCEDTWLDITRVNPVSKERTKHPTQKPIKILRRIILASSNEGDTVLDPFVGSGTTVIACKELGRNYIGYELNPHYIDIINKRLEQENLTKFA